MGSVYIDYNMKILAVGFNYPSHTQEAKSWGERASSASDPIIFHKGDSILRPGAPFFLPDWSERIDYEVEIVVHITRVGKHIAERFAHRYYDQISVGIDFTARDLQLRAIAGGQPWSIAKSFEGSAAIGTWVDKAELNYPAEPLSFSLEVDGEVRQIGRSDQMLHSIDRLIAYVSQFYTLKMGDILFTGTPQGVGQCQIGQKLDAYLGDRHLLHVAIK